MTRFLVIKKNSDRDGYVLGTVEKCHHDAFDRLFSNRLCDLQDCK